MKFNYSICVWLVLWLQVVRIAAITFQWDWPPVSLGGDDDDDNDEDDENGAAEESDDDDRNPYEPYATKCPKFNLLREADEVSQEEEEYLSARFAHTNKNLITFLEEVAQVPDLNASEFINHYSQHHNISIGLAFSGGGYRSMLTGAGQILALDSRYGPATRNGLGGVLQSSAYITGLSGGSWLVGSLVFNDWISVDDILSGKADIWDLEDSIFNPNGINIIATGDYYITIGKDIAAKLNNYETSLTDVWGRALSYQFMKWNGGENVTWSDIRNLSSFKNHEMPFPIVLADSRDPGTYIVNLNSTVYEFSPYEFGSWDPTINSFIDVRYIGSDLYNGRPVDGYNCTVNYDNAGFIMGTSSSLFNQFLTRLHEWGVNKYLRAIVNRILQIIDGNKDDIAIYNPNPFYKSVHGNSEALLSNKTLHLVDGSEDEQNIPLYPLIQSKRNLDVIFAFDNSGDTETEWPNGSAIIHTYRRQFVDQGKGSPIPFVPETYEEFIDLGFDKKPAFFGCDASNLQDLVTIHDNDDINSTDIPLIIYIPNTNLSYYSNTSSFKLTYSEEEQMDMIQNGYETSSRGNLTFDRQWPTCVGCALIRRTEERFGIKQSSECKRCFKECCWEPSPSDRQYSAISSFADEIALSSDSPEETDEHSEDVETSASATSNNISASTSSSSQSSQSDNDDDDNDDNSSSDAESLVTVSWALFICSTIGFFLL